MITIVKNSDKVSWVYSGYEIALEQDSLSFGNGFATNFVIFGIDNSSSSHSDNRKNNFLILDAGLTSTIDGSFGSPDKNV